MEITRPAESDFIAAGGAIQILRTSEMSGDAPFGSVKSFKLEGRDLPVKRLYKSPPRARISPTIILAGVLETVLDAVFSIAMDITQSASRTH